MRIGILGGTFDPPHRGHLQVASAAIAALELDEVVFVPAARNPLKKDPTKASTKHRLAMVERLVESDSKLAASDVEITKGGKSFAVDTLSEFTAAQPADYWFLMGADALHTLPQWKQVQRLLKLCRVAVVAREYETVEKAMMGFPDDVLARIDVVPMPPVHISSSRLRERLFKKQSVADSITPEVLRYIDENGLYR